MNATCHCYGHLGQGWLVTGTFHQYRRMRIRASNHCQDHLFLWFDNTVDELLTFFSRLFQGIWSLPNEYDVREDGSMKRLSHNNLGRIYRLYNLRK